MDLETLTPEIVAKHITAAFDSVSLIAQLDAKTQPLSNADTATRLRNVDHLKIMKAKTWFSTGLSSGQTTQINALTI